MESHPLKRAPSPFSNPIPTEFISTTITVPDAPPNIFRFGLAWGPGNNTFWVKAVGSLYLIEFDLGTGLGAVKATYPTEGDRSVPASVTGIKYDAATGLLAGLRNGSPPSPVSVPVYDVRDLAAGPLWVDNELFTTYNPDIEFQGNVDFGAGYLVALGVNNGLKAFLIDPTYVPPAESFKILSVTSAAGGIALEWQSKSPGPDRQRRNARRA